MKQGVISIQPQWVAKIANGTKKGEIRTTAPKEWVAYLEGKTKEKPQPTTWFVYCTKGNKKNYHLIEVVGADTTKTEYEYDYYIGSKGYLNWCLEGKIIGKFTLNRVEKVKTSVMSGARWFYIRDKKPFTNGDIFNNGWELKRICDCDFAIFDYYFEKKVDDTEYGRNREQSVGYVWFIDNLKIFKKPKDISELYTTNLDKKIDKLFDNSIQLKNGTWVKPLTKAPQSWCYCEVDNSRL